MTREDALMILDCARPYTNHGCGYDDDELEEALNMAISALRAKEIRDDCLSKFQVITAICERYAKHERNDELQFYTCEIKQEMVNLIQNLPSVRQLVDTRDKADAAAHLLMDFDPHGKPDSERIGKYTVYFHGDRLYSVRAVDSAIVWLVKSGSPHEAVMTIWKVMRRECCL